VITASKLPVVKAYFKEKWSERGSFCRRAKEGNIPPDQEKRCGSLECEYDTSEIALAPRAISVKWQVTITHQF